MWFENSTKGKICFIFLSIVIPTTFVILGGALVYIQYRKRSGFKRGIIPCRRQATSKFKNSDESLTEFDNSSPVTPVRSPSIETIGVMNPLVKASETFEVDLFAFSSDITRKTLERKTTRYSVV